MVKSNQIASYAFDYCCFRVTNYRPESPSRHSIAAADLKHDVRLLIEDLSDSADIVINDVHGTGSHS